MLCAYLQCIISQKNQKVNPKIKKVKEKEKKEMEKFLKVTPEGVISEVEIDEKQLLDGFYREIDCRSIETVPTIFAKDVIVIIDEEGRLKEGKIINPFISAFCPACGYIVGTALISRIGSCNGEPDIVGLSEKDLTFLNGLYRYSFGELVNIQL